MLLMLNFWGADFTAFLKKQSSHHYHLIWARKESQVLQVIMHISEKPIWPAENWTPSSIFLDERWIKESWSRLQGEMKCKKFI